MGIVLRESRSRGRSGSIVWNRPKDMIISEIGILAPHRFNIKPVRKTQRIIVKVPSNSSFPLKCKDMSRHKMTSSFGFKEFEGTSEETSFWNHAKEEDRSSLKRRHVDTGECLLCIIDETIPEKPPEPVLPKKSEKTERPSPATPKIVGGIITRSTERVEVSTRNLKVSWAWYNESQGLVAWTFQNTGSQQATAVLYRNSYYFGNAFWPIYVSNPAFGTAFAAKLEPLMEKTIQKNSPPLALIAWKQSDGSYKNLAAFIFTVASGQTWQMLEGGFSPATPPDGVSAYEVSMISESDFCLGYDSKQISAWDRQSHPASLGYSPNPNTFHTIQVLAPADAQFTPLFNDVIQQGSCESIPKETPAQPDSPAPQRETRLWELLARNAGSLDKH